MYLCDRLPMGCRMTAIFDSRMASNAVAFPVLYSYQGRITSPLEILRHHLDMAYKYKRKEGVFVNFIPASTKRKDKVDTTWSATVGQLQQSNTRPDFISISTHVYILHVHH